MKMGELAPTTASGQEEYSVNDHVYVLPEFGAIGQTFVVARIMELLPGPNGSVERVKLAGYYRPDDVTSRVFVDHRLLFAAFNSSVRSVSDLRGRCFVRHKDEIEDLAAWKRQPDCFYYSKFYDPYIKREYDVIPVHTLENIPAHVKAVLQSRFSFIICEREVIAELTEPYQTCTVCSQWAAPAESVKCDSCQQSFHMECLQPSLTTKPAKGYSWACAPCARRHEQNVATFSASSNKSRPALAIDRGKGKARELLPQETLYFRGFPYRYFGAYTDAFDTLDPHDAIFPRSASRVGTKYQTNVDDLDPTSERGGDATVRLISHPQDSMDSFMASVSKLKLAAPPSSLGFIIHALELLNAYPPPKALQKMLNSTESDLLIVKLAPAELQALRRSAEDRGGLDAHEASKLSGRSPADVVRGYRIWKEEELKRSFQTLGRASTKTLWQDGSFISRSLKGPKAICDSCSTREADRWYQIPRAIERKGYWCEECAFAFFKYNELAKLPTAGGGGNEKREGTPMTNATKRLKINVNEVSAATSVSPSPPSPSPSANCACCRYQIPDEPVLSCNSCGYSVHPGCYGCPVDASEAGWDCDLCEGYRISESHAEPFCVLCPRAASSLRIFRGIGSAFTCEEPSAYHALKPTSDGAWCHVLCAMFAEGITFTDPSRFRNIEGVDLIPNEAWYRTCSICLQSSSGAVFECSDCGELVHIACAASSSKHRLGFTFTASSDPVPEKTIVRFRGEVGLLHPGIFCTRSSPVFGPHEMDYEQGQSVLEIYANAWKVSSTSRKTFPLLRKAETLSQLMAQRRDTDLGEASPRSCISCRVDVSPLWSEQDGGWACFRCSH